MSLTQTIIDTIPFGIAVTDLEGYWVNVNPAFLQIVDYEVEDLNAVSFAELVTIDYPTPDQLRQLPPDARPYVQELIRKDGSRVPVELSAVLLADEQGNIAYILTTCKNLSEEMRLLDDLQRRTMQLATAAEVSREAASILDLRQLLDNSVNLIRQRFGFYYAGLFLIDVENEWAVLEAATDDAGKALLASGHRLGVNSRSMVSWVTAHNAPRIALDVGVEPIRFNNPLLPDTRSEMALPLAARGRVIGALDVQSTRERAFTEDDIMTIQTIADQVAIAIDNARLFAQINA